MRPKTPRGGGHGRKQRAGQTRELPNACESMYDCRVQTGPVACAIVPLAALLVFDEGESS